MTQQATYEIGEKVHYATFTGPLTLATIENISDKDGYVVYDLSDGHWCYEDQIDSVHVGVVR